MKRIIINFLFLLGLASTTLLAPSIPAQADNTQSNFAIAGMSATDAKNFLASLQKNLKDNAINAIAAEVNYPLRMNGNGSTTMIKNNKDFVKNFTTIFTDNVRNAVLQQDPNKLFANYQGVMIGNGQVWIANYAKPNYNAKILIKTVNN